MLLLGADGRCRAPFVLRIEKGPQNISHPCLSSSFLLSRTRKGNLFRAQDALSKQHKSDFLIAFHFVHLPLIYTTALIFTVGYVSLSYTVLFHFLVDILSRNSTCFCHSTFIFVFDTQDLCFKQTL